MGEFSIFHWVVVAIIMVFLTGIPLVVAFWIGKKLGDKSGYIRGYKGPAVGASEVSIPLADLLEMVGDKGLEPLTSPV